MIEALRVVLLGEGGGLDVTAAETTEAVVQALDICTQVERAYVLGTSPGSPGGAAMESIVFLRDRAARPFCRIRRLAWEDPGSLPAPTTATTVTALADAVANRSGVLRVVQRYKEPEIPDAIDAPELADATPEAALSAI